MVFVVVVVVSCFFLHRFRISVILINLQFYIYLRICAKLKSKIEMHFVLSCRWDNAKRDSKGFS